MFRPRPTPKYPNIYKTQTETQTQRPKYILDPDPNPKTQIFLGPDPNETQNVNKHNLCFYLFHFLCLFYFHFIFLIKIIIFNIYEPLRSPIIVIAKKYLK